MPRYVLHARLPKSSIEKYSLEYDQSCTMVADAASRGLAMAMTLLGNKTILKHDSAQEP